MSGRRRLLFYCRHSLGLGHLVRSYVLAEELARSFDVVFLRGGEDPPGIAPPAGVEIRQLPPLADLAGRRDEILDSFRSHRPDALVVELFPFGRKKFAPELMPLVEAAREADPAPVVVCSLRDILVDRGERQAEHDERASIVANAYFDAIAVHADPVFARLEESFRPSTPLRTPVHYTGFVVPPAPPRTGRRSGHVLVSAGGGLFGERLLSTAVEARPLLPEGMRLRLVAGPFLPDDAFARLRAAAGETGGIELVRTVPDLGPELAVASASVSQCGYNTALAVVRSGIPALVVPFEEGQENEQGRRACRLERLGLVRALASDRLSAATLAAELAALAEFRPRQADLGFGGAAATAELLTGLARRPRRLRPRGRAWLEPLVTALGKAPAPVTFFFRDDDVGWADERLVALLDRFGAAGAPLDLAVIPAALAPVLAEELACRREARDGLLGAHQHGYTHVNHELDGRRCEFGPARAVTDQRCDIDAGRARLRELLGPGIDPIFTPPWNRCTAATGDCLVGLGFAVLSRESGAQPLEIPGLAEVPVTVDWYGRRKGLRVGRAELGQQLAVAVTTGDVVGVMLHHAELSDTELEDTSALLEVVSSHDAAHPSPMRDLVPS